MAYNPHKSPGMRRWTSRILVSVVLTFFCTSLSAETYRWKDKDGKVHYGAMVPAEYAEQPYDILNNAGIVIEHVEDTSIPMEVIEEEKEIKKKGRQPLISEEERQIQSDKLLIIQYRSEQDIIDALELEIAQLGYDSRLINQSLDSATKALRDEIRLAADQQRSGQEIDEKHKKNIAGLYSRRVSDERKHLKLEQREQRIRARFKNDLDRYRYLTAKDRPVEEVEADQG